MLPPRMAVLLGLITGHSICHFSRRRLGQLRRRPKRSWVQPSRIEFNHPVVQVSCVGRDLTEAVEVTDVLPCFFHYPRLIGCTGRLVSGNDRSRVQRLDLVQRRDPVEASLCVGLTKIGMNAIIGGIPRYDQADRWDVETRGVVRVGMTDTDRDHPVTFELKLAFCHCIRDEQPVRDLAGKDRKSTRLNSSHSSISYAVFCLK